MATSRNWLPLALTAVGLHPSDSTIGYLFDSRNSGTVSGRPRLTVEAVPEPGTVMLWALGMGLLAGGRVLANRRRRA